MSLISKFFTVLTIAGATIAFSTIGMAQDKTTTTTPTDTADQTQKGPRGFGQRRFGRAGLGRRGGPGMRHGGGMGMMFRGLNLTDAQKTQIQSIMAANKPSPESRQEMQTLMTAKRSGTLTAAQQERLTAIRTAAQANGSSVHDQILAVLTPEQKAQIDQHKQQMKNGMQQRGGMGMMFRGLNLTDAQKTQIQSIMAANKPSPESRQEMQTLMTAKRSGTLTAAQQERLTAIRTAAQAKGSSVHDQILAVLTPDQKAQIDQRKQHMNNGLGMRRPGMMGMFRGLNLTDAQKTQIQSIMAANKPSPESRQEMQTLMIAKRTGTLTAAQQEKLTAIMTASKAKRQSTQEQILTVLTPEQKAQVDQRKQQMKNGMQQH